MENILTIFTPTYNRAYVLGRLYKSLTSQKNKSFEWLIVDDGSTDNTKELVDKWIEENKIKIEYIKQENQGKHIAHNIGVDNCKTELFLCVDSDDYLLDNAVEDILNECKYIEDKNICGIVTSRIDKYKKAIGGEITNKIKYSSLSDLYEIYGLKGDTSLVFKSEILRKYKFPKIEGEKFIGEEYIYCQIDAKYKFKVSNNKYYVCEYLEDGYTNNMIKLINQNPNGYRLLKRKKLEVSRRFKAKYKAASLYLVGGFISNEKNLISKSPKKIITLLSYPLAIVIYHIRFRKIIDKSIEGK